MDFEPAPEGAEKVPTSPEGFPATGENSLASIGRRGIAWVIDGIVLAGPALLLLVPYTHVRSDQRLVFDAPWGIVFLVSFVIPVLYYTTLISYRGQTIGKVTMHVRVARLADGEKPTWAQAAIRALLPLALASIPFALAPLLSLLVYAMAMFHPLRQGWHDRAAATVVINTR